MVSREKGERKLSFALSPVKIKNEDREVLERRFVITS